MLSVCFISDKDKIQKTKNKQRKEKTKNNQGKRTGRCYSLAKSIPNGFLKRKEISKYFSRKCKHPAQRRYDTTYLTDFFCSQPQMLWWLQVQFHTQKKSIEHWHPFCVGCLHNLKKPNTLFPVYFNILLNYSSHKE